MKLLFVYNANSGLVNNWLNSAHKVVNPKTYNCDLCKLTHGSFREKRSWKNFRDTTAAALNFVHKDEFKKTYASKWLPKYDFPVVLQATEAKLQMVFSAKEIAEIENVEALITAVQEYINTQDSY